MAAQPPKRKRGAADSTSTKLRKHSAAGKPGSNSAALQNQQSELELLVMDDSALLATRSGAPNQKPSIASGDEQPKKSKLSRKQRLAEKKAARQNAKQRRGSDDEDFDADLQDPRFAVCALQHCVWQCCLCASIFVCPSQGHFAEISGVNLCVCPIQSHFAEGHPTQYAGWLVVHSCTVLSLRGGQACVSQGASGCPLKSCVCANSQPCVCRQWAQQSLHWTRQILT